MAWQRIKEIIYNQDLTLSKGTPLTSSKYNLTGVYANDNAIFSGGRTSNGKSAAVTAYDKSLTQKKLTPLLQGRFLLASATVGGYVIIAGGQDGSMSYDTVEVYDSNLDYVS